MDKGLFVRVKAAVRPLFRLLPWEKRKASKCSHVNALRRLAAAGFVPQTIYDIGAYRGGWSRLAREVFLTAQFVLFEANVDNEPALAKTGHTCFVVALGAEDGAAKPFYLPQRGDATGASLYIETTDHYAKSNLDVRKVETARLDTFIVAHRLPPPDLIKIDVQGAELDVLAGASRALAGVGALIVELSLVSYNRGAPLMAEVIAAIDRLGYRCVDICEIHRTDTNYPLQLDLLFVTAPLFVKCCEQVGVKP